MMKGPCFNSCKQVSRGLIYEGIKYGNLVINVLSRLNMMYYEHTYFAALHIHRNIFKLRTQEMLFIHETNCENSRLST
jgi:hypothetical protein